MPTDAPTAFFSYSRNDSEFVLRLAGDLKAAGANVWLDQLDIQPGQRWARAVQDALNNSPRLLVVLSPSSVASTNVDDEVNFALEEHKTVIPVFYQDCKVPFQLRPFQYVDFRTDYAGGLKVMLKTLSVEQQATVSAAAAPEALKEGPPTVSDEDDSKHAAEQARLEQERKQVAEQARVEEERRQAAEKARLEQEERERLAAERTRPEQPERERPAAAEKARLEQEEREPRAAAEKARLGQRKRLILGMVAAVLVVGAVVAYLVPKQVTVPDISGTNVTDATAKLQALKLAVGRTTPKEDATKDPNIVLSQSPPANTRVKSGTAVDLILSQRPQPATNAEVPELVGKSLDAARQALEDRQLAVGKVEREARADKPQNTVLNEFPSAGEKVKSGSKVDLMVSEATPPPGPKPPAMVSVPNLVGESLDRARTQLQASGLVLGSGTSRATASAKPGTVVDQKPGYGQQVQQGSRVDLLVAKQPPGPAMVAVPQLLKRPVKDAEAQLQQQGLSIGAVKKEVRADLVPGTVVDQTPAYGQQVSPGSKVDLTYSVVLPCRAGYVWRGASPTDHVCVLPAVRAETLNDNAQAAARRAGNGSFGADTCKQGYVWRDAFPNDHVCVTPATRKQAAEDNAAARSRIVPN